MNTFLNFRKYISRYQIKYSLALVTILVVGFLIRFWNVGKIPPGLTPDEAALGYNAYSILHTGRDEYGKYFPIIFKSFGDYKPGLYVYLDIPFVAMLGLNEMSTRLPSVLAGVLTIYLTYLLIRVLFPGKKHLPYLAAIIAALNPYLIYFGRGAWEANISLTLTLAGIYFFLRSFKNNRLILLSIISFALTLLTYQGAKLSSSIVVVLLFIIFFHETWKIKRNYLIAGLVIGFILSFPIILSFFQGQASRLTVFSIFSYKRPTDVLMPFLNEANEKVGDPNYILFHSENLNYFRGIMSRYFNTLSGRFLFFEGDTANPIHTAPYQGVLLITDILLLSFGFYAIFKNQIQKGHIFFLTWMLLAPLSAALSRDQTNAVRSLNLAIPLVVIITFGLNEFYDIVCRKMPKLVTIGIISALYVLSFGYFLDAYFVHVPAHNSEYWRYGYREVVEYIVPLESKYQNIVFEQSFNQPYIYFLFYGPKDPKKYQIQEKLVNSQYIGDVGFVEKIDKINFKQIDWQVLKRQSGTLVIASPVSLPPDFLKDAILIKEIKYLNGRDVAFDIIEIK